MLERDEQDTTSYKVIDSFESSGGDLPLQKKTEVHCKLLSYLRPPSRAQQKRTKLAKDKKGITVYLTYTIKVSFENSL